MGKELKDTGFVRLIEADVSSWDQLGSAGLEKQVL